MTQHTTLHTHCTEASGPITTPTHHTNHTHNICNYIRIWMHNTFRESKCVGMHSVIVYPYTVFGSIIQVCVAHFKCVICGPLINTVEPARDGHCNAATSLEQPASLASSSTNIALKCCSLRVPLEYSHFSKGASLPGPSTNTQ